MDGDDFWWTLVDGVDLDLVEEVADLVEKNMLDCCGWMRSMREGLPLKEGGVFVMCG